VVLAGMLVVGWYVSRAIERGVITRLAGVTSLYVDNFVAPHLQSLLTEGEIAPQQRANLDRLLTNTALGKKIVAFKIWNAKGRVLYSTNPALTGRTFPVEEGLAAALQGHVHSDISDLSQEENELERPGWPRLIETYSPVHADGLGKVLAAAEFYQLTDELERETLLAKAGSWGVVAMTSLVMYLLLFGVVRRGSETIEAQRAELNGRIAQLSSLLRQNAELHAKVRHAALRTTALNEEFLRRVASDLHDGAAQDLALALMRVESLAGGTIGAPNGNRTDADVAQEMSMIRTALQSALRDLRATAMGLQLPDIDRLDAVQVAARAVHDFKGKTGSHISLSQQGEGEAAQPAWPVKITMYRLIQEALGNGVRHGAASRLQVGVSFEEESIVLDVRDNGCGFDPLRVDCSKHLGLAGMRERVELLRGSVVVSSAVGKGTLVRARLPLNIEGEPA